MLDEDEQYDIASHADPEKYAYRSRPITDDESTSPSSTSSSRASSYGSHDQMIRPSPQYPISSRCRSYHNSSYLYQIPNRIVRWLCIALMSIIILFILSLVRLGMNSSRQLEAYSKDRPPSLAPWQSFEFLERYYGGIRTLSPREQSVPEYPRDNVTVMSRPVPAEPVTRSLPESKEVDPCQEHKTAEYERNFGVVNECFLDASDKISVPRVHAHSGIPRGFPETIVGSYDVLGLSNSTCYDRYGRLGPYGYGYSTARGGIGVGLDGEREGAENVWGQSGQADYSKIRWADAQARCLQKNRHRFRQTEPTRDIGDSTEQGPQNLAGHIGSNSAKTPESGNTKVSRTAIVIRTWSDFNYNQEVTLFLRAMISELVLASGGEYTVHFLVHVKDDNLPIWADPATYDKVLKNALPEEFRGMGQLWSERQMGLIYGGLAETFYQLLPVHGVYRSIWMPLQRFAQNHPEYDYFWNVEMDVRYTGHWYEFLNTVQKWAKEQPRKGLWERNDRFYIPSVHGTWNDFKHMVRVQSEMLPTENPSKWANVGPDGVTETEMRDQKPIWGAHAPPETSRFPDDPIPPTTYEKDQYAWGVGEEADFISFNPMFDPARTDWKLAQDVTGYNTSAASSFPPRRASIITTARLSRRLLEAMHAETALQRRTMFSEMWPASVALHHGLKAVYAPHPVFVDRAWPMQYFAKTVNNGRNGASGGARGSVFGTAYEHNLKGLSWYFNSGFAPNLWRRWLGYRVDGRGGEVEEVAGEGRMCLPGILLHPVKDMHVPVEGTRIEGEEGT